MPLTRRIYFNAILQKHNRIAVPKLMRWQFKMEADQILKVGVKLEAPFKATQNFYAKMSKDGRILIPMLTLALTSQEEKPDLAGHIFEITLEPA
jgi:hypothetical protein